MFRKIELLGMSTGAYKFRFQTSSKKYLKASTADSPAFHPMKRHSEDQPTFTKKH